MTLDIKVPEKGITFYGDKIMSISDILEDKNIQRYIKNSLPIIFSGLGFSKEKLDQLADFCIESAKNYQSLRDYEVNVHTFLEKQGIFKNFFSRITNRAEKMFDITRPYLVGKSVLDLGCGKGEVGAIAKKHGYDVCLADVYKNPFVDTLSIPFIMIDQNEKLPFENSSFDNVLIFAMLHHTHDPGKTISEVNRILKPDGRLHIIETVYGINPGEHGTFYNSDDTRFKKLSSEEQRLVTMFFDYFGNHITWYYTDDKEKFVPVPFNFGTPDKIKKMCNDSGFHPIKYTPMGIHDASQVYHVNFIFEKK